VVAEFGFVLPDCRFHQGVVKLPTDPIELATPVWCSASVNASDVTSGIGMFTKLS
jgi:hypothetical protein